VAETPVRAEWLADEAVQAEPVSRTVRRDVSSRRFFPAAGKSTGKNGSRVSLALRRKNQRKEAAFMMIRASLDNQDVAMQHRRHGTTDKESVCC
jgi:hypothetical protein